MYHLMLCCLADATLPPFPSGFRLPLCDLLLTICVLREAITSLQSIVWMFPTARISFVPLHCLGQGPVFSVLLGQSFFFFFIKPFLMNARLLSLIIRGIFPSSSTSVRVFILFNTRDKFQRAFHPPGPRRQPDASSLQVFAPYAEEEGFVYFLVFSHSINSLYPIWIIGRLTAIWKNRWCFPDLPPPSLSWLKGN